MKRFFLSLLPVSLFAILFAACEGAETYLHFTGTIPNVFDVKKSYLYPSFSDTAYFINDISAGDGKTTLANGDRAYIMLNYEFDPYSMKVPKLTIGNVVTKITRRELKKKGSFDVANYNSPFKQQTDLVEFYDMSAAGELRNVHSSDFLWADAETQNIVLTYKNGLTCEPQMVVDSLRETAVGTTLFFRLYAKISNGWPDNEVYSYDTDPDVCYKIISYNMDWDLIKSELTAEEQALLVKTDSLTSCIHAVTGTDKGKDGDGMYIPSPFLTEDKFANPLYKK